MTILRIGMLQTTLVFVVACASLAGPEGSTTSPSLTAQLPTPPPTVVSSPSETSTPTVVVTPSIPDPGGCARAALPAGVGDELPPVYGGQPQPIPILMSGEPVSASESLAVFPELLAPRAIPADLPLQLTLLSTEQGRPMVRTYYRSAEIDEDTTFASLFESRALMVMQRPATGATSAETVKATVGLRATIVAVADVDGALIHEDPLINGIRPYDLYWSDGTRDFGLFGSIDPNELLDTARSIYCSAP